MQINLFGERTRKCVCAEGLASPINKTVSFFLFVCFFFELYLYIVIISLLSSLFIHFFFFLCVCRENSIFLERGESQFQFLFCALWPSITI